MFYCLGVGISYRFSKAMTKVSHSKNKICCIFFTGTLKALECRNVLQIIGWMQKLKKSIRVFLFDNTEEKMCVLSFYMLIFLCSCYNFLSESTRTDQIYIKGYSKRFINSVSVYLLKTSVRIFLSSMTEQEMYGALF